MNTAVNWPKDDVERIKRTLAVENGHLWIGRGDYTLHYANATTLSGYDVERMKADCIAAGLPVIDSRDLDFDLVMQLAYRSPLIAVGEPPDPQPWHALAKAPLQHVGDLYRAAGAEVINLPAADEPTAI